jgi:hypothetical protein
VSAGQLTCNHEQPVDKDGWAMTTKLFAGLDTMDTTRPYLNPYVKAGLPNKDNVCTVIRVERNENAVTLSFKENGPEKEKDVFELRNRRTANNNGKRQWVNEM